MNTDVVSVRTVSLCLKLLLIASTKRSRSEWRFAFNRLTAYWDDCTVHQVRLAMRDAVDWYYDQKCSYFSVISESNFIFSRLQPEFDRAERRRVSRLPFPDGAMKPLGATRI